MNWARGLHVYRPPEGRPRLSRGTVAQGGDEVMDEIKKGLERELSHTVDRIRRMGGGIVFEDFPGALGDNAPMADEVDVIRVNEDREMSFATRSLLVERANKLAEALERLRGGEY